MNTTARAVVVTPLSDDRNVQDIFKLFLIVLANGSRTMVFQLGVQLDISTQLRCLYTIP